MNNLNDTTTTETQRTKHKKHDSLKLSTLITLILLVLLELISGIIYVIILILTVKLIQEIKNHSQYYASLINSISSIILEIFSILWISYLGLYSVLFKKKQNLFWYIVSSITIFILIWMIYLVAKLKGIGKEMKPWRPSNFEWFADLNFTMQIISMIKSSIYFLSFVLMIYTRQRMMERWSNLPLEGIDECWNEELYNNIIQQGKDPDNEALKAEYEKIKERTRENVHATS